MESETSKQGIELPSSKQNVAELLQMVDAALSDPSLPRSVKGAVTQVRSDLTDKSEPDLNVRKNHATSRLEEITDDPNLPIHGRTVVWDILSRIESL